MTNSINGLGNNGDDFYSYQLAQAAQAAAAGTQQTQQTQQTQFNAPAFQGYQQPTTDVFEKQSGSNLGNNLILAGTAGAGTAGALYQWGTKPVNKDGKLTDGFKKEFGKEYSNIVQKDAVEKVFKAKGKLTSEILGEIKNVADGGDVKDLSAEAKKYMIKNKIAINAKSAENFVKGVEDDIVKIADPKNIALQTKKLETLQGLQKQFEALPDAKKGTLEKYLVENAEEFGLKGKDEAALKKEAQALMKKFTPSANVEKLLTKNAKKLGIKETDATKIQAEIQKILTANDTPAKLENYLTTNAKELGLKGKTPAAIAKKAQILAAYNPATTVERLLATQVENQQNNLKTAESVFDKVAKLWNKDKGVLNTSSDKQISAACEKGVKNFKWKTAGKVGAAVAAGTLALGWLFGGKK